MNACNSIGVSPNHRETNLRPSAYNNLNIHWHSAYKNAQEKIQSIWPKTSLHTIHRHSAYNTALMC